MTDYLVRRFVKDYNNISDSAVRGRYGLLSGGVGVVVNMLLCLVKMTVGLISGSVAIVGDAFHNLTDAGTSVVTLLGFQLSAKPADAEHPFGHGRIEYIAGLVIAGVILLLGFELIHSSIDRIFEPTGMNSSLTTVGIMLLTICVQLWLGLFNKQLGQRIDAPAMTAAGVDSLSDCMATVTVIICMLLHLQWGYDLDGVSGVIVGLFILHNGWTAAKDTLQPLLGEPPDPSFVRGIRQLVLDNRQVLGVHDLIVHNYGPGRIYVSLHVELPSTMDIMKAHYIAEELTRAIDNKFKTAATIHVDPMVGNDKELNRYKTELQRLTSGIDPMMNIHDLHRQGSDELEFDVAAPYRCQLTDDEIITILQQGLDKLKGDYRYRINIDRL